MENSFSNAGIFLVNTLGDLIIFIVLMRIILVSIRADYYNPLSQVIIKLTQPIIKPLRRVIPNIRQLELASVLVAFVLECLKFLLLGWLAKGLPNLLGLAVLGTADGLKSLVNIFFYAIVIQAIMSWINPGPSAISDILYKMTAPIIRPFRRLIPPISGMDLSPIPAMICLQLLIILLISPLFAMGWTLAFS